MMKGIVFGCIVLIISFSIIVSIVEVLLLVFRNSISFNIQYVFRRMIPFVSLATVIVAAIVSKTTNLEAKRTVFISGTESLKRNSFTQGISSGMCYICLAISSVLLLQYLFRYLASAYEITKGEQITVRFSDVLGDRKISVYSWKKAKTPFCFGIFKKSIVLPENYSDGIYYAVKHEISHCDNYDPLTILVAKLITLVMWFNPLAYVYYQQLRISCEYACDERVTKALSFEDKKEYVSVILASTPRTNSVFAGAAFATEKTLKSRFKNVLSKQRVTSRKSIAIVIGIVAIMIVCIAVVVADIIPERRTKSVKIDYSSEQEVQEAVDYEEYIDGKWFRGELHFDSISDLGYGVKSAEYSGILYEGE